MPYIIKEKRPELDHAAHMIVGNSSHIGDLNFAVSRILDYWLTAYGKNYSNINDLVGMLDCAKMEFYRRVAVPYESVKIAENGDVYDNA